MQQKYIHPVEQLIHSTVRIECKTPAGTSSGSGYFFAFLEKEGMHIPCIITNKHVIKNAISGSFHLTVRNEDESPNLGEYLTFTFDKFEQRWIGHPDPTIDLAIFLIGPILNEAQARGKSIHYMPLDKPALASKELLNSLPSMEEIIMIGYPNGIWDAKHNLPIIRRGITATHPKLSWNGKPEFLIDAACFPGSSGSPVFLANIGSFVNSEGALCTGTRIALLGTLYAGPQHTATGDIVIIEVPTSTKTMAISTIPNNLGLVIHASRILDFEPLLENMMTSQAIQNA